MKRTVYKLAPVYAPWWRDQLRTELTMWLRDDQMVVRFYQDREREQEMAAVELLVDAGQEDDVDVTLEECEDVQATRRQQVLVGGVGWVDEEVQA